MANDIDSLRLLKTKEKRAPRGLLRPWLAFVHKTIGLFLGAIFVLIGLSGAILVYRDAIDERMNSELMLVTSEPGQHIRPVDEIFDAAKSAMPQDARVERITMPRHERAAASVTYISETDDLDTFVYELFVDPYTAQVKGQRLKIHGDDQFSQPIIPILMGFHWTLLLGANNAYLIGSVSVLLILSTLAGFYLWWPVHGDWKLGVKIKWSASRERIFFDIHRAAGFYFGAILIVSLLTGVAMIFKPMTREIVSLASPVSAEVDFGRSKVPASRAVLDIGDAVKIADKILPEGRLHWVLLPTSPTGVYVVGKQSQNEPNISKTFHNVGIDQYSGEITGIQDRDSYHFGDKFMEWLFPLHSGEFLGAFGRPVFVVLGLTPLIFYVTGFLRWIYKRRARKM